MRHLYKGMFTDGTRWSRFEHQPGEIFVCTPPKCGTTWTQAICALLVFQRPDLDVNPAEISPWFDSTLVPLDEVVERLRGQAHRHVIKTHTPLDGIPYFEDARYVVVYRDPRDVFFSLRNHVDNMKLDLPKTALETSPAEAFHRWLEAGFQPGEDQGPSLAGLVHHYETFRSHAHLPNIELYHYSDLKRDLLGEMKRMADHLDIGVAPELISRLAETASFENMRRNAERFAPGTERGLWQDSTRFFNRGTIGQWRDELTPDDDARFRERLASMLPDQEARWLIGGSGDPSTATGPDSSTTSPEEAAAGPTRPPRPADLAPPADG